MSEVRTMSHGTGGEWDWPWVSETKLKGRSGAPISASAGEPTERALRLTPKTEALWVGKFSELKPSDFGTKDFHGRFHPEIVAQAILRYIQPERRAGSLIWDPMAGGGTTGDVAREFGVPCAMTDINPARMDIRRFDATSGPTRAWRMIGERTVDLLILHPPYWSAVDYGTEGDQAPTAEAFAEWFGRVVLTTVPVVRHGGHVAFVIGSIYRNSELHPLDLYCLPVLKLFGLVVKGRIVKDFGETKGGWKGRAGLNRYRALKSGYWNYDFEHVYFLKKLGEHFR